MGETFLTHVDIVKVRHLQNITIPLDQEHRKHLILTGKNGSGKTSVLDALSEHLRFMVDDYKTKEEIQRAIDMYERQLSNGTSEIEKQRDLQTRKKLAFWKKQLEHWTKGATVGCTSAADLCEKYKQGKYILAYYKADRVLNVETSSTIETIQVQKKYKLDETPGTKLVKYMVALKATQAFAIQKKDDDRAAEIGAWFERFEGILKRVFDDPTLTLDFDIDNFSFKILQENREPFDFNTMSSGYSAVFDIINDLIMRMENGQTNDVEGIVLIDEIDTHLHLELQKNILPILTNLFPGIQFVVSTHSPFILNSIENAVVFDLETKKLVEDGLANCPYDGIVEGYFAADRLSSDLRSKLERYRLLTGKEELTDEDYAEIVGLEHDLDEIPDFLSPEIASEYSRLKLEFSVRG